jgi:hypothetical protein
MSLAHLTYAWTQRPFIDPIDNYLEIVNELTVLLVTSILLGYPDGLLKPDVNE